MTTTTEVPGKYDVAVNGRGFMVDWASGEYRHQSIELLRQQSDTSGQPTEASVNPDDLWRRSATTWHHGAGQRDYDSSGSDPARFYRSKNLDPWNEGELRLLPDVRAIRSGSLGVNYRAVVAGAYLYLTDGTQLIYTQDITVDPPVWTGITGESGTAPNSIASNGNLVWTAHGAGGVYQTTRGTGSTAKGMDDGVDGIRFAANRLFGWEGRAIYNITDLNTGTPTAWADQALLLDHDNVDFVWTDVTAAAGFYFLGGFSGDKSLIYSTQVKEDGTALTDMTVAAELPDGEVVRSLFGYLGFVMIGTDHGVRFASPDGTGQLTIGALIETPHPVLCFEGQDRFVWFGWTNFDGDSTGLGRMDLSVFDDTGRPAFASDLMAGSSLSAQQGAVQSIVTFQGQTAFTFAAGGMVTADAETVKIDGWFETGRIAYQLQDSKVSHAVNVIHTALGPSNPLFEASVSVDLASDGGAYSSLGTNNTLGAVRTDLLTGRVRGEWFDLRVNVTAEGNRLATEAPVIGRVTLRAEPTGSRSSRITVPLRIGQDEEDRSGAAVGRSAADDVTYLEGLEAAGDIIDFQEPQRTLEVIPVDHIWQPRGVEKNGASNSGVYLLVMKRFAAA